MFDNNLNPVARDISLYFDWNAEMLKYESTEFKVGNTVKAGLLSSHELNMLFGDFTDGYKNGDYPLAVITFKVIAPGDTPILIKVARVNDMEGNPVKFVASKGMHSISGDAIKNPGTVATPMPTTAAGGVIVVTPATTYTLIPTIAQPAAQQPIVVATTLPPAQTLYPAQVGGAPGWPVLTAGATIPTPYPTTIETTVPTAVPTVATTVETTVPTTVPTTVRTTFPTATPTTEETTVATTATTARQIAYQTGTGYSAGIPIYDTPTVNETPTTLRTLPQPLPYGANLTEEPTEEWPLDETPTVTQTLYIVRGTPTKSVVNNTSALAASATGGSGFGDAWMYALAAIAGVGLVALGVVVIRRGRDDDL
jgi:hypothetical protein